MNLRQTTPNDQIELKKIYFNSINSIDKRIYSLSQKVDWSSQAWDENFNKILIEGEGWIFDDGIRYLGFAIRFPKDKLALFYCVGDSQRIGIGTKLLKRVEEDAREQKVNILFTEASLISYKLLLKHNWEIVRKEKINIKESIFERYKMKKYLS